MPEFSAAAGPGHGADGAATIGGANPFLGNAFGFPVRPSRRRVQCQKVETLRESTVTLLEQVQDRLRRLPPEKQSEMLDFVTFLQQRTATFPPTVPGRSLRPPPPSAPGARGRSTPCITNRPCAPNGIVEHGCRLRHQHRH